MSGHNALEEFNQETNIALGGKLIAYGTSVPGSVPGYATGCLFMKTDGGDGNALYVNEGSATSATFKAIVVAA
tara:strand:- start:1913 stop:2131 length:219 start_codon:yes stop_codon:yes gene_type:complete